MVEYHDCKYKKVGVLWQREDTEEGAESKEIGLQE